MVLQAAGRVTCFQARPALLESLAGHVFKVGVRDVALRHVEFRKRLLHLFELDVTTLRDLKRAVDGVFKIAEDRHHFLAGFQVELGLIEAQAVGVAHGLAGLDAQHDLVSARIAFPHVMRVVGGDQRNPRLLRQAVHQRNQQLILVDIVVLDFEEEVFFPEHVLVLVGHAAGVFVTVGE